MKMKRLKKFARLAVATVAVSMVMAVPAAAATHTTAKNVKCYGVMTCTSPNMCKTQENLMVTKATCEQLGGTTKMPPKNTNNMNNMPSTTPSTMTQPAPSSTTPATPTTNQSQY